MTLKELIYADLNLAFGTRMTLIVLIYADL